MIQDQGILEVIVPGCKSQGICRKAEKITLKGTDTGAFFLGTRAVGPGGTNYGSNHPVRCTERLTGFAVICRRLP